MSSHCIQVLNLIGLMINAGGAILLVTFGAPSIGITEGGEQTLTFFGEPASEERQVNLRKRSIHTSGFRIGLALLAVGYIIQMAAAYLRLSD